MKEIEGERKAMHGQEEGGGKEQESRRNECRSKCTRTKRRVDGG